MAKKSTMVIQQNKLIEAKGRMTIMEQKILRMVISQISPADDSFREYQIDVANMGLTSTSIYSEIKSAADRLLSRKIEIEEIDPKTKKRQFYMTRFLSGARYMDGCGHLTVTFDPGLKPYLLNLQTQFTRYELKNVMEMRSAHALRIYELLKQYQKIGTRAFELDELKKILGIAGKYSVYKDLERRVLIPARTEINAKTDLDVSYEKIKNLSGVVDKIVFLIRAKKTIEPEPEPEKSAPKTRKKIKPAFLEYVTEDEA